MKALAFSFIAIKDSCFNFFFLIATNKPSQIFIKGDI